MAKIPEQAGMTPESAYEELMMWYQQQEELRALRAAEILRRKRLADYYFHAPREGTNRLNLGGGFDLLLQHSFNRTIDAEALESVKLTDLKPLGLQKVWDDLFVYKPSLSMPIYRELSQEQAAFVDRFLEIKEATPSLSIVAAKADAVSTPEPQAPAPERPAPAAKPRSRRASAKKAPAKKAPAKKAAAKRTRK